MEGSPSLRSVIFDLDGTLIDSSPSILECFATVLANAGLHPVVPLDSSLIGPPLRQTLMNISGLSSGEQVDGLVRGFQEIYDVEGYKSSRVYPGVEELLCRLAASDIPLAIATNKRRTPTLKILDYLGWSGYFRVVGTLDTPVPPHANKAALIRSIVEEMRLSPESSLYVGDKLEDGEAAEANRMPFFAAGWGYGDWGAIAMPPGWRLIRSPHEIVVSGRM